ncbi:hypothetical protein [Antrihabitans stalactiti]|uniref:DUF2993 domain-containing protein n=1 Tax=Antrihabitans stalactiti TaxID=2584121 RepID=A0A848KGL2_9NOCA|nr:hypothetical protein [Antrihabitans stalactiti]NMN95350.1 hypothetical protein [Antrihabitans stalactiti]
MTSYFDPKAWSPFRAAEVGKSWMDGWVAATTSWVVDPVATLGMGTVTALLPDVLMTVLSDGILSRFLGRDIDITVHGMKLRGILKLLAVRRRGALFEGEIELTDVRWSGYEFDEIRAVANGMRLVPGVPTKMDIEQIDLEGRVSVAAVVAWLNTRGLDWQLSVDETGLVKAYHTGRRIHAVVDASVNHDLVRIEIRSARWLGLPLPTGLVPAQHIPLQPLPNDARIVRAVRDGTIVRFKLDIPMVKGSLDLAQIRAAIVAGTGLIVW